MTARLTVHSLGVTINGATLLSAIDLTIESGEWVGLIGPNGAGKTTMLHAVTGITDSIGFAAVDGENLASLSPSQRARRIALVPQRPVIPPGMEVFNYVLLGRTPYLGVLAAEGRHDIDVTTAAMTELGVADLADRSMETLSGGELQRVVLARALAQEAEVLLLDEPTSALDVGNRQQVLEVIDRLRATRGLTVLSALHDLTLAAQFCDRLALLAEGRLVSSGTPQEVLTEETIRLHYDATVNVIWIDDQLAVIPTRQPAVAAVDEIAPVGPQ